MQIAATHAFLLVVAASITACDHNIYDGSYDLRGTVVDSVTNVGIDGAIIAYRNRYVPDTVAFPGDTLNTPFPVGNLSNRGGHFDLGEFPGGRDTSRYRYLFAWKSGYKLWRNDISPRRIVKIDEGTDTVHIELTRK